MTRPRLLPHADSLCRPVHSLEAEARALRPGVLRAQFTLIGDLRRILIPQAGPGGRADGLWRHTCFEAFVRHPAVPGYLEFNFSPSGAWQVYRFSGYRQGMTPAEPPAPPYITVGYRERDQGPADPAVRTDDALVLEAIVPLPVPFAPAQQGLRLALSAVVEEETGALSYWALRHAPGRPDFHHPDAFALTLHGT